MERNNQRALVPGLRTPDQRTIHQLSGLSTTRIPVALARTRNQFDDFSCNFCGFTSGKYQLTVQHGPSHRNLRDLATACRPCWQVMNLSAAASTRSAKLIWLPEISQAGLNRSIHQLYAARIAREAPAVLARSVLKILIARDKEVKEHCGITNLEDLVSALQAAEEQQDQAARERLFTQFESGLRVLPFDRWIVNENNLEYNQYPQMLAYFRSKAGPVDASGQRFIPIAQDWLLCLGARIETPTSA